MEDFLAFDLETQRSAEEVGGWGNIAEMKMSVGVIWDSTQKKFFVYLEDQVHELIQYLKSGLRVIGFNHLHFDYPVLTGYFPQEQRKAVLDSLEKQKNLDLLINLKEQLGHRLKLDSIVRPTLGVSKSADGLLALQWYKEYLQENDQTKLKLIIDYCKQDVAVTRDLYLHGLQKQEIFYEGKNNNILKTSVNWAEQKKKQPVAEQLMF